MSNNIYKIYVHINKFNGKLYIGQTKQKVNNRFGLNGHGYKECKKFWNAIQKYGWDNFDHIVLFENLSVEMANIIESELIKKYNTMKYGYNLTTGGLNGYQTSKESNMLKSITKIGNKNPMYGVRLPNETIQHIIKMREGKCDKKVINLNTLIEYKSMTTASQQTGQLLSRISQHCNLNIDICHREWLLYDDYIKLSFEEINDLKNRNKDKNVININTNKIYKNSRIASLETGVDSGNISRSCNYQVPGGLWMYLSDYSLSSKEYILERKYKNKYPKSKKVINLDNMKIYNNAKEAAIDCGRKSDTTIRQCINGKYKKAFGYHWMDYEDYLKL